MVWGISCWIGSGWCSGKGPWRSVDGRLMRLPGDTKGVHRQLIHLTNGGRGVHRQHDLYSYMYELAVRLRYVRVCCGDWQRVVTAGALVSGSTVGIFLDPPYDTDLRTRGLYINEGEQVNISADVRKWCIQNGNNPRYRIVLAGYDGEHEMPEGWQVVAWKTNGGYANFGREKNNNNKYKERLWLSPHCLHPEALSQPKLFNSWK